MHIKLGEQQKMTGKNWFFPMFESFEMNSVFETDQRKVANAKQERIVK